MALTRRGGGGGSGCRAKVETTEGDGVMSVDDERLELSDLYPIEGDVVVERPAEGWSPRVYQDHLEIFRVHRKRLPRFVKLHHDTVKEIMSKPLLPEGAPTPRPSWHHDRNSITLSDEE